MSSPAFQFYASDFLTATQSWDINEVGIYIRLLSNQWVNLKLPNDTERLARIAGCSHDEFKKAWVILGFKFLEGEDGFLRNTRLESVRSEKNTFLEKQRLNGLKGGRPKKENPEHKPEETQGKPKINPTANPKKTSSSSSVDINIYSGFLFFNEEFKSVWDNYLDMRRKMKKPATKEAQILGLKKIQSLVGDDFSKAKKIVEQSIFNSYQGLFDVKQEDTSTQQKKYFPNSYQGGEVGN